MKKDIVARFSNDSPMMLDSIALEKFETIISGFSAGDSDFFKYVSSRVSKIKGLVQREQLQYVYSEMKRTGSAYWEIFDQFKDKYSRKD